LTRQFNQFDSPKPLSLSTCSHTFC